MKTIKSIFIFLFFLPFGITTSQNVKKRWRENIKDYTKEIKGDFHKKNFDFSFMKSVLINKRIVFLGESSHQTSEFHIIKNELVKYLSDSLGFSVLVMEYPVISTFTINDSKHDMDERQMTERMFYSGHICAENIELMKYLRITELFLIGFDTYPDVVRFYRPYMQGLFGTSENLERLLEADSIYVTNRHMFPKQKLDSLYTDFLEKHSLGESNKILRQIAEKGIKNRREYLNRMPNITPNYRDSVMAEHVEWICNTLFPDKKIIVWAANIHIQKKGFPDYQVMGSLLSDSLKKQSYFLGLYAHHGKTGLNKDTVDIKVKKGNSLNNIINSSGYAISFTDFSSQHARKENLWMFKKIRVNEWAFIKTFRIPYDTYDGVIQIKETTPSKLLK